MSEDDAIKDLKDELLLTGPNEALETIAFAYQIDVVQLRAQAVREIGDLSTYAERVAVSKADADRLEAIAKNVEAEASLISRVASHLPKPDR